ncbi:MAG: transcription termination factor Rho [Puniceicoccales bacterium]|jgi:transcription termination factor Rho|nr:transcription termination factor Rho [Puniceicoccales bacterium]
MIGNYSKNYNKPKGISVNYAGVDPGQLTPAAGILEIESGGRFGNLIGLHCLGKTQRENPYIARDLLVRYRLRRGMALEVKVLQRSDYPNPRVIEIEKIDGLEPTMRGELPPFEERTSLMPDQFLSLETKDGRLSNRVIDLFAPVGKGQRGLIVAPPKTGKTTILHDIAVGIRENHPDCHLIILLIDERPEEITDFRRTVDGELFASSNDEERSTQIQVAELAVERAKRLAETGKDVVVLLDSITRLARAYNRQFSSGRTMTGGVDVKALERPRMLFSSARNLEGRGSLTILATALVETGSRMDDLIFQEFKGTGNMEIVLNKKAADMRIYPAIDVQASGTRKEECLLSQDLLGKIHFFRRALGGLKPEEAADTLIGRMKKTKNNKEFLILLQTTLSH